MARTLADIITNPIGPLGLGKENKAAVAPAHILMCWRHRIDGTGDRGVCLKPSVGPTGMCQEHIDQFNEWVGE
jgi:hypothetical protein